MLLTVGLLHGELTTLLWGGAFGFLWAYVMAARAAAAWACRDPRGSLDTVTGPVLRFRAEHLPTAPALFSWWLVLEGRHSPSRRFVQRVALTQAESAVPVGWPRGRYEATARWELTDAFGFSRFSPKTRWETLVIVPPGETSSTPPPPPPTRPGPWRPQKSGRRAGDPFDVRPYHAGDDLRRLHWPLYAHSDVPFVRTAEPSPPPTGHQYFVLDTEAASDDDLDPRLESVLSWVRELDARATGWSLAVPAADLTLGPGDEVGAALAGLLPTEAVDSTVGTEWPATVTLISGPGSRSVESLKRRLIAARRSFNPVVIPRPHPVSEPRAPWWQR